MPLSPFAAVARDSRFAVLALRRDATFVAVASVSLALALGVVTSVYGVVDAAVHPPSAVQDPARVVYVANEGRGASPGYSAAAFTDLVLQRQRAFDATALIDVRPTSFFIGSHADFGFSVAVSHDFFRTS